MIETVLLAYLKATLDTNDVYLETPKTIPSEFVLFQIVDRSRENLIDAVTVEIYSYSTTKAQSCKLDEKVREAMYEFTDVDNVSSSKLGGGNDAYDTNLKKYRYRCYFNVTYM